MRARMRWWRRGLCNIASGGDVACRPTAATSCGSFSTRPPIATLRRWRPQWRKVRYAAPRWSGSRSRALEKLACPRRGDPHRGDACAWRGTWGCQHSAQPPTTVSEQAYCVTMAHSPTAAHTKAGEAPCVAARKATISRALTNPAVPCGCSLLGACARSARIECPCDAQC